MSINHLEANRNILTIVCGDEKLPERCKIDTRLAELYRATMEKLAKDNDPSNFTLYAKVVLNSFSEEVIQAKGRIIKAGERAFLVRLKHAKTPETTEKKQPQLFILDLNTKKVLGMGYCCIAQSINEIISGEKMVFKCAITHGKQKLFRLRSLNELRHAKRTLKALNPEGTTKGIQKKPYATIGLTNPPLGQPVQSLLPMVGTLERCYDSELFDRISAIGEDQKLFMTSQAERFEIGKQLLEGLVAIHRQGYTHGDLKLDNALILGQGEQIQVDISDFGSAKSLNPLIPPRDYSGTYSRDYNLESDIDVEEQLFEDKNWTLLHFYQTQRDLFEMGVLLAKCLTATDPFDSKADEFIDLSKSHLEQIVRIMWQKPLSHKILHLLNLMLNPNPLARPTAEQALELYLELIPQRVRFLPAS